MVFCSFTLSTYRPPSTQERAPRRRITTARILNTSALGCRLIMRFRTGSNTPLFALRFGMQNEISGALESLNSLLPFNMLL